MSKIVKTIEEAAQYLAEVNHEYAPEITRTYWFPDPEGKEIRMIHVSPNAFGNDGNPAVRPFYFGSSLARDGIAQNTAIGMVLPEEEKAVPFPDGWGDWNTPRKTWDWNGNCRH